MTLLLRATAALLLALAAGSPGGAAEPANARCFTSDDGAYPCRFRPTGGNGSFEISAPGKPTYLLDIVAPGTAYGFANFGDRNVSLPGAFHRSRQDRACWDNEATGVTICAW